jgi:hypothetical protein
VNKNSASHNAVDVSVDTFVSIIGREINDRIIGVSSKFCSEPYQSTNLFHCLLTCCCLSSLITFTLNLIDKSISRKLQKKEGRSFLHPSQKTRGLEAFFAGGGL